MTKKTKFHEYVDVKSMYPISHETIYTCPTCKSKMHGEELFCYKCEKQWTWHTLMFGYKDIIKKGNEIHEKWLNELKIAKELHKDPILFNSEYQFTPNLNEWDEAPVDGVIQWGTYDEFPEPDLTEWSDTDGSSLEAKVSILDDFDEHRNVLQLDDEIDENRCLIDFSKMNWYQRLIFKMKFKYSKKYRESIRGILNGN